MSIEGFLTLSVFYLQGTSVYYPDGDIQDGDSLKMPLAVEVHHALIDGVHVGKFYIKVQDYLQQPEIVLGET